MKLYPLQFEPRLVPKLWGGRRLQTLLGRALPPQQPIGESWEIYDRGWISAPVADGPLKGQTLGQLVREFGPALLGQAAWEKSPDRFPLLVKLIDASDWLSVQVHPDDDYAALHVDPDESGKTEMWYVLDAPPGCELIAGFRKGTDRAALRGALTRADLDPVLNRFSVRKGDCVFLPAGRVHAIGKGCFVAEIQQNSDTTYRLHDFGRLENGKPRDLHLQQALECLRLDDAMAALPDVETPVMEAGAGWELRRLAQCPYFRVARLDVAGSFRDPQAGACFHVLMGLEGTGTLKAAQAAFRLDPGRSLLLPAGVDWKLEGPCAALWTRPGI